MNIFISHRKTTRQLREYAGRKVILIQMKQAGYHLLLAFYAGA